MHLRGRLIWILYLDHLPLFVSSGLDVWAELRFVFASVVLLVLPVGLEKWTVGVGVRLCLLGSCLLANWRRFRRTTPPLRREAAVWVAQGSRCASLDRSRHTAAVYLRLHRFHTPCTPMLRRLRWEAGWPGNDLARVASVLW